MKKFDVVIGNTPYLKNTHLDFLEKGTDLAEMVIMIHSSGCLSRRSSKKEKELIKNARAESNL